MPFKSTGFDPGVTFPSSSGTVVSTSEPGKGFANVGGTIADIIGSGASLFRAIKGTPETVQQYYGTDNQNAQPRDNTMLFLILGVVALVVLLFVMRKK